MNFKTPPLLGHTPPMFGAGIDLTRKLEAFALVQPGIGLLHRAVVVAARGSQVPIVRE